VLATQETVASLPTDCTITVTGYRNGEQVASQDADFSTGTLLAAVAPMQKIDLKKPGFKNVDRVEFETDGELDSTTLAVLFDNIAYDVTVKKQES
jgi:hypothetical protein